MRSTIIAVVAIIMLLLVMGTSGRCGGETPRVPPVKATISPRR